MKNNLYVLKSIFKRIKHIFKASFSPEDPQVDVIVNSKLKFKLLLCTYCHLYFLVIKDKIQNRHFISRPLLGSRIWDDGIVHFLNQLVVILVRTILSLFCQKKVEIINSSLSVNDLIGRERVFICNIKLAYLWNKIDFCLFKESISIVSNSQLNFVFSLIYKVICPNYDMWTIAVIVRYRV